MIKPILLGLIAVMSTLAGGYAGTMLGGGHDGIGTTSSNDKVDIVRLEPSSVPIIRQGKLAGYVVARASVTAAADEVKNRKLELSLFASEAVFKSIFEEESFDFAALRPAQLSVLNDAIVKTANGRMGQTVLKQSIIENLSFVAAGDVRCSN